MYNKPKCIYDPTSTSIYRVLAAILNENKNCIDALAVCQAHRGLPVGFLLLLYLVLFTVESLSLLYLLVIS